MAGLCGGILCLGSSRCVDRKVSMRKVTWLTGALLVVAGAACRRGGSTRPEQANPSAGGRSVVVYSSADKEFSELVFAAYEKKTGVRVLPVYDTEETKTAGLTARLLAEASHPRADVFWSSDTSRAVALLQQGIAEAYASPSAAAIPDAYKDSQHRWTGFAARIRVILYNTTLVKPTDAPRSILDFAKPSWRGRVAIANPHFGTMSFQAAALFVKWGDTRATDFFRALKSNGVIIAAGNSDVKDRVSDGRVAAGIVDEDDAIVALQEKKPVAIIIPDQEGAEALGTPVMPNTGMLVHDPPHPEEARRFLDFLLSPEVEKILAESAAAQFPLHQGVPGPSAFPPLEQIRPFSVDYEAVARMLPTMDGALRSVFGI
jgi:iron(III) transport system substrate-binding protein